jgi:hypothetical protein
LPSLYAAAWVASGRAQRPARLTEISNFFMLFSLGF